MASERTLTYSNNDMLATLKDAENNLTTYENDGFDRLSKTRFPVTTKGGNASSTTDYELVGYDTNSNVTSRRLRDANSIGFIFDNLNRVTVKDLPGSEPDVTYVYDNLDRPTSASQTGNALSFVWDALSRKTSEGGPLGTTTFGYDLASRRTSITYPSTTALTIDYAYLTTGELDTIKQGATALATYSYDDLGNRTSVTFANGAAQAFTPDPVSRLSQLTNNLSGTTNDLTATLAYNPASQITSTVRTGDVYAWTGHGNGSTAFTQNGLNQQITVGGSTATWDSKGNLTTEPQSGKTYGYSSENLLTSATGGTSATLAYDPALRLYQVAGAATARFLYEGTNAIAEYNGSNALQRRFVFDPTTSQPVIWYEGTGTASTDRRYLSADERGSIISVSDSTGISLGLNKYDEYGKPQSTNLGRFQYTGQMWLPEIGAYYYKARIYLPHLGVFAQTDPAGYGDSPNLYAYVLNDPVNLIDPLGLDVIINGCGNGRGGPGCTSGASHWWDRGSTPVFPNPTVQREDPGRDIVITGRRKTQKPTQCQVAFLKDVLGRRGLPTGQIQNLTFVSGLAPRANMFTRLAYNGGATAVTQGNTVFVQPGSFDKVANFRSPIGFEEAYHSAQYQLEGGSAFYNTYGLLSIGGILSSGRYYHGNLYENFAQGAAEEMFSESQSFMCRQ